MINLTITDVRVLPGDCAFLLDSGKTTVLYDTGFGFTGSGITGKIKHLLKDRPLDYILLTHSHYDHVLAAPHILKKYPNAKVIAGEYASRIFAKASARETMRRLDQSAAEKQGMADYEDLTDELRVDIVVQDGDEITCGEMTFSVIGLPGHTKCSLGFYLAENKLLLAAETLGVYFGKNTYLPSCLVGYQMSLDSFAKAKQLDIESLLIPHYGVVSHDEAFGFLENSEKATIAIVQRIKEILESGGTKEDAVEDFKERFYVDHVRPTYPIDAFYLNTRILVDLVEKELLQAKPASTSEQPHQK